MGRLTKRAAVVVALTFTGLYLSLAPASAEARVDVRNSQGSAAVDPTHLTQLQLSGSGFESIKNGHGGIYVLFGAVKGTWQPSKGGQSGKDYFTVPDNESKNNSGYAKFVTFPGSDTGDSANGGEISSTGRWSTTINVPGAKFKTLDRSGKATTIDCREMTCGVITIGAHGVSNAENETFTQVSIDDLGEAPAPSASSAPEPEASSTPAEPAALTVDRSSARPGRIVAFSATGLAPGTQVNATFADGLAAAGPLTVNSSGQAAGLIEIPDDVSPGTYELRLVGRGEMPATRFAVLAAPQAKTELSGLAAPAFATSGLLALLGAVVFGIVRWRSTHAA